MHPQDDYITNDTIIRAFPSKKWNLSLIKMHQVSRNVFIYFLIIFVGKLILECFWFGVHASFTWLDKH